MYRSKDGLSTKITGSLFKQHDYMESPVLFKRFNAPIE